MVAISLYRGNLHRVPDVPRRWLMPNPKISLKDFKSLLARRSKALSRLQNPNPNPLANASQPKLALDHGEGPSSAAQDQDQDQAQAQEPQPEHRNESQLVAVSSAKKPVPGSYSFVDSKNVAQEKKPSDAVDASTEKQTQPAIDNVDQLNEKEERKKEVEDKLEVLNAKKHNLVLVLKQILNAEEELKRQNSMQAVAMHGPMAPGDATNDTGSMTRHMALTRLGSEGNLGGDVDGGGEVDDFANHNMHSRHVLLTSSMSPSSESPLRRTPSVQQNAVVCIAYYNYI